MKTCSACGTQNPEAARFCRSCGNPFATEAAASAPATEPTPATAAEPTPEPAPTQTFATVTPQPEPAPAAPSEPTPAPVAAAPAPAEPAPAAPAAQPAPQQQTTGYVPQPAPQAAQPAYVAPQQPQPAQPAYAAAPQAGYAPAPGAPVAPVQPSPSNEAAKAFGQWLLASLKRPASTYRTQVWWSFVVTVVTSLVTSLLIYTWAAKAVHTATNYANGLASMFTGSTSSYSAPAPSAAVWFKAWIAFLVLTYAAVLMTFIGRKILGDPKSFFEVHDMYAQRMVPFCVLYVVLILLSLVGGSWVALVLFYLAYLLTLLVLPGALIAKGECHRNADSFWLWLGAIVVCFVILIVALMLSGAIAGSAVSDVLNLS